MLRDVDKHQSIPVEHTKKRKTRSREGHTVTSQSFVLVNASSAANFLGVLDCEALLQKPFQLREALRAYSPYLFLLLRGKSLGAEFLHATEIGQRALYFLLDGCGLFCISILLMCDVAAECRMHGSMHAGCVEACMQDAWKHACRMRGNMHGRMHGSMHAGCMEACMAGRMEAACFHASCHGSIEACTKH
jgi:hypothetical protein